MSRGRSRPCRTCSESGRPNGTEYHSGFGDMWTCKPCMEQEKRCLDMQAALHKKWGGESDPEIIKSLAEAEEIRDDSDAFPITDKHCLEWVIDDEDTQPFGIPNKVASLASKMMSVRRRRGLL